MKKVLISATLLIGMMASAMVFSSFTTPKENVEVLNNQVSAQDDWREVGRYSGYIDGKQTTTRFIIWEKQGMCGSYYWTVCGDIYDRPDNAKSGRTGKLMLDGKKNWYASLDGIIYYIHL